MNDRKETILTKTPVALLNEALKAINQLILKPSKRSYLLKNAHVLNHIICEIYHYAHYKLPLYEVNDQRFELISKENLERRLPPLSYPLLDEEKVTFSVQCFTRLVTQLGPLIEKLSHPQLLTKLADKIKHKDTDLKTQFQGLFAVDKVSEINQHLSVTIAKTVVTDVTNNNNNFDITNIPIEIWIEIISHAGKNLLSLMLTSKFFNNLFKKEQLWKAVLENNSPGNVFVTFNPSHRSNYHFKQDEPVSKRKFRAFFEDIEEVNPNQCYICLSVTIGPQKFPYDLNPVAFINNYFRSNKDFDRFLEYGFVGHTSRRTALKSLGLYPSDAKLFILGFNLSLETLKKYMEKCSSDSRNTYEVENMRQHIFEITVREANSQTAKCKTPVKYLEDQDILVEVEKPEFKVSKRL